METIAVIGAGMMGPGISQVFAAAGHAVRLIARSADKFEPARARVQANLEKMAEYELADRSEIPSIVGRISFTTDLREACDGAGVVIETITEDLALKQQLFAELEHICDPATLLCTNTSVLRVTEVGGASQRRERILGTHFYQPPHLVPLVEVVQTEFTSPERVDRMFQLLAACGKVPVRVLRDVAGFIANRMQHALWREAFALIDEGICDPETVDVAVRNSFGLRLPVLGPVANADLVGLDLTYSIHRYILPKLDVSTVPSSTLRSHLERQEVGFKSGQGFLRWNEASISATRERLATFLLEILRSRRMSATPAGSAT